MHLWSASGVLRYKYVIVLIDFYCPMGTMLYSCTRRGFEEKVVHVLYLYRGGRGGGSKNTICTRFVRVQGRRGLENWDLYTFLYLYREGSEILGKFVGWRIENIISIN